MIEVGKDLGWELGRTVVVRNLEGCEGQLIECVDMVMNEVDCVGVER
jgi:hypothetical protein